MNTTEERNKKKTKSKENKKHPYKVGGSNRIKDGYVVKQFAVNIAKNKKGGIGDIFGAISFFVVGFLLGHFFGQKLMDMFIQMIRRLITNGFSGSV